MQSVILLKDYRINISDLPYSGKFSRSNIFVVFNNQIYLWKKFIGLYLGVPSQLNHKKFMGKTFVVLF